MVRYSSENYFEKRRIPCKNKRAHSHDIWLSAASVYWETNIWVPIGIPFGKCCFRFIRISISHTYTSVQCTCALTRLLIRKYYTRPQKKPRQRSILNTFHILWWIGNFFFVSRSVSRMLPRTLDIFFFVSCSNDPDMLSLFRLVLFRVAIHTA